MTQGAHRCDTGSGAIGTSSRGSPAPILLGVVNLSPESMVQDSVVEGSDQAIERARALQAQGVGIIDLGGRSITPDVPMIDDEEERARLAPVAARFRQADLPFSIDTWSPTTAMAALDWGAQMINFTGQNVPPDLLDAIARAQVALVMTYMPYGDAYQMRSRRQREHGSDRVGAIIDFFVPRVEAARAAGVTEVIIDPNLGIIHSGASDYEKIHTQLDIVWQASRLRTLNCPLLMYAARKPDLLARIMMASAVLLARPEYIRTHEPEILQELMRVAVGALP